MIVYPAIDLLDGQVVRLVKGDFQQVTVYETQPQRLLARLGESGAQYLHLVDLSGARDAGARQLGLLRELLRGSTLKVQVGGGLRSLADIAQLLDCGADRVVLGSLAVSEPQTLAKAVQQFGTERLTIAVDLRSVEGQYEVMVKGWQQRSELAVETLFSRLLSLGLTRILCTDIQCDGMMTGPNIPLYQHLLERFPTLELQASGGVTSVADLQTLRVSGLHSAIVGRAWLSGQLDLPEALRHAL